MHSFNFAGYQWSALFYRSNNWFAFNGYRMVRGWFFSVRLFTGGMNVYIESLTFAPKYRGDE